MGTPPFLRLVKHVHLFKRLVNLSTFVEGLSTTFLGGFNPFHLFRGLVTLFFLEVNVGQNDS